MKNNLISKIALLLCFTLVLSVCLCACGSKTTEETTTILEEVTADDLADATAAEPVSGAQTGSDSTTAVGETTAVDATTAAGETTTAAGETTTAAGETTTVAGETTTAAEATTADVTALTTEQIIEKYNKAANEAKSSSKSIKQNYCINSQVSKLEVNNAVLKPVANKLIESNMGADKKKAGVVYNTPALKVKNFPVSGQSWASKLTKDDVKSATITKNGNVSTITIKLKDDLTPNKGTHHGKAFSLVTKQQIVDGAGSIGMKFIKEKSIALTYKNGVITAKIDETTGRMTAGTYYIEWGLALSTTVGLDVSMYFGIKEDYTINW